MATINGLDIHHEIEGEGPPIVFIHGLGATSNVWHAQRTTLSKYYRVIVYDRSGSGRSQRAPRRVTRSMHGPTNSPVCWIILRFHRRSW